LRRRPRRAGEVKPTNPTNQAQQWYSHALLKVMRLQRKHPEAVVALGLPEFPPYRALFEETRGGLARLGMALLTVRADGTVRTWGLHGEKLKIIEYSIEEAFRECFYIVPDYQRE
jgi:hypothetical protein